MKWTTTNASPWSAMCTQGECAAGADVNPALHLEGPRALSPTGLGLCSLLPLTPDASKKHQAIIQGLPTPVSFQCHGFSSEVSVQPEFSAYPLSQIPRPVPLPSVHSSQRDPSPSLPLLLEESCHPIPWPAGPSPTWAPTSLTLALTPHSPSSRYPGKPIRLHSTRLHV